MYPRSARLGDGKPAMNDPGVTTAPHRPLGLEVAVLFASAALGALISYVDSRPAWDDAGITAFALFGAAVLVGLARPSRPWLCALLIWAWLPAHHVVTAHRLGGGDTAWLLVLLFPLAGVYGGRWLRGTFAR